MKNILRYASVLLVLAGFASCVEQEPVWVAPTKTMSIEQSNLVFEPAGGTSSFTVKAENPFTVATDREWCTATASGSQVTVTVGENTSNETRYSRVTLTSGTETLGITVHQSGLIIKGFSVSDQVLNSKQHTLEYSYSTNGVLNVSTTDPWISVNKTSDMVTITVDANNSGSLRTGTVSYSIGDVNSSFSIVQSPAFTVNDGWKLSYAGRDYWHEYVYENFAVEGNASDGTYYITVVPSSEYESSGMTMDEFAELYVFPKVTAELAELVEYYESYPLEAFLFSGDGLNSFQAESYPAGSYYAFAVGVNTDGSATGKYSSSLISTAPASYNYWLGTWKATSNNNAVSTLTIAAKETGKSYVITGLGGTEFPVNAVYNADGTISILASSTASLISSPFTYSSYVFSAMYIYGLYPNGGSNYYRTGSDYNAACGTRMEGNKARITGMWNKSGDNYYEFIQLVFRGPASDNGAASKNTVFQRNYLPFTLEKQ